MKKDYFFPEGKENILKASMQFMFSLQKKVKHPFTSFHLSAIPTSYNCHLFPTVLYTNM